MGAISKAESYLIVCYRVVPKQWEVEMVIENRFLFVDFVGAGVVFALAFQCFYYSLALFISWWVSCFSREFQFTLSSKYTHLICPHDFHCFLWIDTLIHKYIFLFFSPFTANSKHKREDISDFFCFCFILISCYNEFIVIFVCKKDVDELQYPEYSPEILWFIEL